MRESVIRNTDRIDTLYDLRKSDNEHLSKKVEKLVVDKIANVGPPRQREAAPDDNDKDFLRCRRSIRLWPVQDSDGLERGIRRFLTFYLKMPVETTEGLTFERISKQAQTCSPK